MNVNQNLCQAKIRSRDHRMYSLLVGKLDSRVTPRKEPDDPKAIISFKRRTSLFSGMNLHLPRQLASHMLCQEPE